MNESNLKAKEPFPRVLVYELGTCGSEGGELGSDVVDLVGNVMHPRPAPGEEATNRRVIPGRGKQLDPALSDQDRRRLDSLLGDRRPVLECGSEQTAIGCKRFVEIVNRDAEMVDSLCAHAAMLLGRSPGGINTASTSP